MQLGSSTIYGDLKVTGLISGALVGNSATAEALATARTITFIGDVTGSVVFDGSKDVSMTTVVGNDSHNHTTLTGVTSITGAFGTMMTSTDEWLRINFDSTHSSGTFFGATVVRTDGTLQVGSSGTAFKAPSDGKITASASFSAPVLISTVATGTAPLTVTSTTVVTNLNVDQLDGKHASDFALASSIGNGKLTMNTGTYLTGTTIFTANQSADTTFTVATNATTVNTPSTLVARGTNGEFSAGDITLTGATIDNIKIGITGTNEINTSTGNLTIDSAGGNVTVADNLIVSGNLTVNGTTVTVNSTITTLDDPVITLGGDTAPTSDDSKDRGIEYRWHNGTSAKIGFFGLDDSTGNFTFIPDATNTSEVFSGTKGTIDAYVDMSNIIGLQSALDSKQPNIIDAICDTASATAAKVVTISNYTLTNGDMFAVKFTLGSSVSTPTLNINGAGAKNIRLGSTNASTTTMTVGTNGIVLMYYDGEYFQLLGSHRTTDSTVDANMYHSVNKTMGAALYSYKLIAESTDGKYYPLTLETGTGTTKTISTAQLKLGGMLLYYDSTTTVASGSNVSNTYSEISMSNLHYTFNQSGGYRLYEPIYLVGTIVEEIGFKLDNSSSTSFYTQDLPTTEDGKIYIYLGQIYSTNSLRLTLTHPIYEFKDGALRKYIPNHAHNPSEVGLGNVDNVKQAPATRNVTAGNGLTGGGTLTADITITLGTPSDLSATTTNNVTATSHTHNIISNVTASSLSNSSTNTVGTSTSLARADHTHEITGFALSSHGTHVSYGTLTTTILPDAVKSNGVSTDVSRTDHTHAIATDTAVTISNLSSNSEGSSTSFARADHSHSITGFALASHGTHVTYGSPVGLNPDCGNVDGVSTALARADHKHDAPAASAVSLSNSSTSTEGTSTSFARADHTHAISGFALATHGTHVSYGTLTTTILPDAVKNNGSSTEVSRTDHTHAISTDIAVTISNISSNSEGSSTSFARADHSHQVVGFALASHGTHVTYGSPVALSPDCGNVDGTSSSVSRADHKHDVPAATAVTLSNSTTNTEGTSVSFARADHTHAITTASANTANVIVARDGSGNFSGSKISSTELVINSWSIQQDATSGSLKFIFG